MYQTLVIDNLTEMWRIWDGAIMDANKIPALRIQDYKTLQGILHSQFIPSLKALKTKIPYIVCIVHEDIDKEENTGKLLQYPIGPSKAMGRTLAGSFDDVMRQVSENGKYIWRTKSHGWFESAGSRFDLPDRVEPATFYTLQQLVPTISGSFCLLVGAPKTGKTVSAGTFPKPMCFLDLDDGSKSIYHTKENGSLVVKDSDKIDIVKFHVPELFDLNFNSPDQKDFRSGSAPNFAKNATAQMVKYNKVITALSQTGKLPEDI